MSSRKKGPAVYGKTPGPSYFGIHLAVVKKRFGIQSLFLLPPMPAVLISEHCPIKSALITSGYTISQ